MASACPVILSSMGLKPRANSSPWTQYMHITVSSWPMKCTSTRPSRDSASSMAARTALAGVVVEPMTMGPSGVEISPSGSAIIFSAVPSQKFRNTRNFAPTWPSSLIEASVIDQSCMSAGVQLGMRVTLPC